MRSSLTFGASLPNVFVPDVDQLGLDQFEVGPHEGFLLGRLLVGRVGGIELLSPCLGQADANAGGNVGVGRCLDAVAGDLSIVSRAAVR
jgi:hypothetical protein